MFQQLFDEYFNPPPRAISLVSVAVDAPRAVDPASSLSSTTIDQDVPSASSSLTTQEIQSQVTHQGPSSKETTLQGFIPSNLHHLNQSFDTLTKLTMNHPLENVICDPSRSVLTRSQLQGHAIWCYFDVNDNPIPLVGNGVVEIYYLKGRIMVVVLHTQAGIPPSMRQKISNIDAHVEGEQFYESKQSSEDGNPARANIKQALGRTYNTASATLMRAIMIQKGVSMPVRRLLKKVFGLVLFSHVLHLAFEALDTKPPTTTPDMCKIRPDPWVSGWMLGRRLWLGAVDGGGWSPEISLVDWFNLIRVRGLSVITALGVKLTPFPTTKHQMDQWGDHAVHCCSEVGVKFRHNLVRDILVDICSKVGIFVRKEAPMGFLSHDEKDLRPADLLLFNWLQGKDACLDVTGISPFAGTGPTLGLLGQPCAMPWRRKRESMRPYAWTTDTSSYH
nr:pentatricopeptide repeat (PPR) superfamily protein [Tanacetum cinerariifolium]